MEVKPIHILGASIFAFFAIVAANILTEYRSNAEFRDRMAALGPSKLLAIRTQRVAEELMETVPDDEDVEVD